MMADMTERTADTRATGHLTPCPADSTSGQADTNTSSPTPGQVDSR
jgi:hypothetical protein